MNSENQSPDNSRHQPSGRLVIIPVLTVLALVAQYAALHLVLTRTAPAHETGGFRYYHWEYRNRLATDYMEAEKETRELEEDIQVFFEGEDMKSLVKYLADYESVGSKLESNQRSLENYAKEEKRLVGGYNLRLRNSSGVIDQAYVERVKKDITRMVNQRNALRDEKGPAYEQLNRQIADSNKRLSEYIRKGSQTQYDIKKTRRELYDTRIKFQALQAEISGQNRDQYTLLRAIWLKWGGLEQTHKGIEERWNDLVRTHKVIELKLKLMEIQDADLAKLHNKFLNHNQAAIKSFHEQKSKWAKLRQLEVQDESKNEDYLQKLEEMKRVGTTGPNEILSGLENLHKNMADIKEDFDKLARGYGLQTFQVVEEIHRGEPKTQN